MSAEGLQLHLGCGADRWSGWVNIDREPGPAVDQVFDIRDLHEHFAPGSCRAIHLMHAINYLTLWEARHFFRTCMSLLAPGGELAIETADAASAARRFLENIDGDFNAYLEGIRAFPGFGLDHLAEERSYTPNSMAWTPWHMERELRAAGFATTQVRESRTHAKWRDFRVEAFKSNAKAAQDSHAPRSIVFVVDEDAGHVTAHLRARMFVEPLEQRGHTVVVLDAQRNSQGDIITAAAAADVTVFSKVPSLELLRRVRTAARGPVVFDFTDALWLPHHQSHGWQDLHALLTEVDALLCDNEVIAQYGRRFNAHVHLWPASTQVELFDATRTQQGKPLRETVRIGWVGSQGTATALHTIADSLTALVQRVPNVELRVLGCDAASVPVIPGLSVSVVPTYDEATMIAEMVAMDVGVFPAPLSLEDFRNRGPLKGALYMSAGLPMICQRGGELDAIVQQGVNGFTADGAHEWTEALVRLASDASLRAHIGANARSAMGGRTREAITDALVTILEDSITTPRRTAVDVPRPSVQSGKPRVLIVADVRGWIFERHAQTLRTRLADEFDIEIGYLGHPIDEAQYDLIYPLEYNLIPPERIAMPWKYVTGLRSHISWDGVPPAVLSRYLARYYQRTHMVSQRLLSLFAAHLPSAEYVSHGIDMSRFQPVQRVRAPGAPLRVGWAGNRASPAKGFSELIRPLGDIPGVELVVRGYSDRNLSLEEMPEFYAGIDVYVCASSTEGNNNSLLEAAATACAIVTSDTGTVPEYLPHDQAALVVPRTAAAFRDAVIRLRDDVGLRHRLGNAAAAAVHPAWSWNTRAEHYRQFLRAALAGRTEAETRLKKSVGARSLTSTMASVLDTLQRAMATGNLTAARSNAERLVTLDPTNAEFRALYRELHPAN